MMWVSLASLILRIMSSPSVIPLSPHDDLLQVQLALQISKGNWLGSYGELGQLTMVKPPGYPIFLAFSTLLGISPQILIHLLLLLVTAMIVRQIIPATLHKVRVFVFAVGVLWPTLFGAEFSRYYREGLIHVLSLAALLLMISICRTLAEKYDQKWIAIKLSSLGLCLGLILITKPITLAYVPALGVIFLAILVKLQTFSSSIVKRVLLVAGFGSLTIICTLIPPILVSAQNQKMYGMFQVDSFRGGSFKTVISEITALPPHDRAQSEMVSNEQLKTLSKAGPYSSDIAGKMLSEKLKYWSNISCFNGGACNSSGAWFPYALRDAIAMTGEDRTAIQFNNSLETISAEIKLFCNVNDDCGGGDLAVGVKSPSDWVWFEFVNSFVTVVNEIVFPTVGSSQYLSKNQVTPEIYEDWVQMPGIPLRDSRSNYTNPVPGFLRSLILPMVGGAAALLFMRGYGKRSAKPSQHFRKIDTKSFSISKITDDVAILGIVIGLGSFLCLASQLAALQASSGAYLQLGADVYSITCLAPFFVFIASLVSYLLQKRIEDSQQNTEQPVTKAS
jgi:hypothetical protein